MPLPSRLPREMPRHARGSLVILAALLLVGCSAAWRTEQMIRNERIEKLSPAIGPWENRYKGDPNLAGVIVTQYPEGEAVAKTPYQNKHPASIWYVYWNGDVMSIQYAPDGSVQVESLWTRNFTPGSWWWGEVDFSHGSDPLFRHHADPRQAIPRGENPQARIISPAGPLAATCCR